MSKKRRHFSPEEKVAILKLHLLEKLPVSQICKQHDLHPNQFSLGSRTFSRTVIWPSKPLEASNLNPNSNSTSLPSSMPNFSKKIVSSLK